MREKQPSFLRALALAFVLVLPGVTAHAQKEDATAQVKAEIARLQQSLKAKPLAVPGMPDANATLGGDLAQAEAAANAGCLYESVERLARVEDLLAGLRAMTEKADTVKGGMPAFETEWGKASLEVAAMDKQARKRDWARKAAAMRAIAESAQGRATPLLEGARGFAQANGPQDGLLYMGEAAGQTGFAKFVYELDSPRKAAPLELRSLLPELEALQVKTNAAFKPPRSIDLHPRFIALNSSLKFARDLDASRAYAGALYQYLEAVRHYGMLDAPAPDAAKQAGLRSRVAQQLKEVASARRDDSIAQIFLERAAGYLNKPDGAAPSADEWRAVAVIVEQVLPAYNAVLTSPMRLQQRAGKTATLTLVRWPYT